MQQRWDQSYKHFPPHSMCVSSHEALHSSTVGWEPLHESLHYIPFPVLHKDKQGQILWHLSKDHIWLFPFWTVFTRTSASGCGYNVSVTHWLRNVTTIAAEISLFFNSSGGESWSLFLGGILFVIRYCLGWVVVEDYQGIISGFLLWPNTEKVDY